MAIVDVPGRGITLTGESEIAEYLGGVGIDYERWHGLSQVSADATDEEVLNAYSSEIERLKRKGGYVTADVINIVPTTPGLDEMLAKFNKEHWHDEDEVRFIVKGRGLFHIAPENGDVVSIEMEPGDLIRVPRGMRHWFNLCGDRTVRAIRLFQDVSGWQPHYTNSGVDAEFQPVCFGPGYSPGTSGERASTVLATERSLLRPVTEADHDTLHRILTDEYVRKYLCDDEVLTPDQTKEFVRDSQQSFAEGGWGLWLIVPRGAGEVAGFAGLRVFFDEDRPQLLYALLPEFTGRGYATEAAARIADYAFAELGFESLTADCDPPNTASHKVAERIGMRKMEGSKEDGLVRFSLERT